ncbi:MAG: NACHT domain-containing protein [Geminicoccaceae bacterium]
MSGKNLLCDHLAPSVAKALAGMMFQAPVITNPLVDYLAKQLKGRDEARQAKGQIDRLAKQCLEPVLPIFASAKEVNPEAVEKALGETIERHEGVKALLKGDLDRERVLENLMTKQSLEALRRQAYGHANIALYRRALPVLLDKLIAIAPKLEGFEGASAAEILRRLTELSSDMKAIRITTDRMEFWIDRQEKSWQEYASKYRALIEEKLDVVQLFGIKAEASIKRQRLSTAFIPLSLTQATEEEETTESSYFATLMNGLSPKQPRLLITGPAGSGKTTLMRWAAMEAAAGRSAESLDAVGRKADRRFAEVDELEPGNKPVDALSHAWQLKIPFLIPLRACKDGKLPKKDAYPALATKYEREPPPGWVQSVLDAGEALVLIDGIDEVPHKNREEIKDQLTSLCKSFKGNYLVFTTRPGVIDDDWFADLVLMRADVNPLGERERSELIRHWHEAAAEDIGQANAEAFQAGLTEQLRNAPEITLLGTSPLLCAAICVYHYMTDGDLPKKQAELCDELCKLLIHRRDFARKAPEAVDPTAFGLLDYEHKALLIRALAQRALRNGESALDPEIADALIAEKLPGFRLRETLDASFVRERLVERSGVLREAYGGGVDFAHNTLRDFLAGQAFSAEPGGIGELAKNVGDQAWHRPTIFAASDRQHDVAEKLIRALMRKGTRIAKKPRGGGAVGDSGRQHRRSPSPAQAA